MPLIGSQIVNHNALGQRSHQLSTSRPVVEETLSWVHTGATRSLSGRAAFRNSPENLAGECSSGRDALDLKSALLPEFDRQTASLNTEHKENAIEASASEEN